MSFFFFFFFFLPRARKSSRDGCAVQCPNRARISSLARDEKHYDWAKKFKAMCQGLVAYVKKHHAAGVAWGNKVTSGWQPNLVPGLFREPRLFLSTGFTDHDATPLCPHAQVRSMTFWSNAIAQTAPGDEDAERYIYNYKLGMPVARP